MRVIKAYGGSGVSEGLTEPLLGDDDLEIGEYGNEAFFTGDTKLNGADVSAVDVDKINAEISRPQQKRLKYVLSTVLSAHANAQPQHS